MERWPRSQGVVIKEKLPPTKESGRVFYSKLADMVHDGGCLLVGNLFTLCVLSENTDSSVHSQSESQCLVSVSQCSLSTTNSLTN